MIKIIIEWKKSKIYGYNPAVTLIGKYKKYFTKVSGYGYDKESAAIGKALNLMLKDAEEPLKLKETDIFDYGVSLKGFETGGVGIDCFRKYFVDNGYCWEQFGNDNITVILIHKGV